MTERNSLHAGVCIDTSAGGLGDASVMVFPSVAIMMQHIRITNFQINEMHVEF